MRESTFVGREKEMAVLTEAWQKVRSGRGQIVMLVGEPGIGKTRLAREFAAQMEAERSRVLWGRNFEDRGAPPYWAWIQALREYVRDQEPEKLKEELGMGASVVADLLPEVLQRIPDVSQGAPVEDSDFAQFRLHDSLTAFLKNASESHPIALVLEDLHWSDAPSLQLLEFFSQGIAGSHLLFVGTYRDVELSRKHPLSATLAELTRERLFERVPLRGLDREDVIRLLKESAGSAPPSELVETIYSHTEGNPLFITEVIQLLAREGKLTQEAFGESQRWDISVPEGVKDVIGKRLNKLTDECNELLSVAAIIGRQFHLPVLSKLMEDLSEDKILEILEEALSVQVIEEMPELLGQYQFTHALVQETLIDELSVTRRVRMHAKVAEALESFYGEGADAHAAELVEHFAHAEMALGSERIEHYSILAGEQALESFAAANTVVHFTRALDTKQEHSMDDEKALVLFGLARCWTVGRAKQLEYLDIVFDYYVKKGNTAKAVVVASTYPVLRPGDTSDRKGITERLEKALELVTPGSPEAALLLYHYGVAGYFDTLDLKQARKALERSLEIARCHNDKTLEVDIHNQFSWVLGQELQYEESLKHALSAISLAQEIEDMELREDRARFFAFGSATSLCDIALAEQLAKELVELSEKHLPHGARPVMNAMLQGIYQLKGEWQKALEISQKAGGQYSPNVNLLQARVVIEYQLGNFDSGKMYLRRLIQIVDEPGRGFTLPHAHVCTTILTAARNAGETEYLNTAEEYAGLILRRQNTPLIQVWMQCCLGLLAVLQNDSQKAQKYYDGLLSWKGTFLNHFRSTADGLLGLLADTMGDYDAAVQHYEDAMAICRKAGLRPELAWTHCDCADTLLKRNGSGDHATARSLYEEGLALAQELSMTPLQARIAERLGKLEESLPDGLSAREVEVLRLVSDGMTNQEIAEKLFISEKTVGNHLTSVFNKTSTRNRTEAARYASAHNLTVRDTGE